MKKIATLGIAALVVCGASTAAAAQQPGGVRSLSLERIGTVEGGGAEVISFDPRSERLFVSNAGASSVDIYDASNPRSITPAGTVPLGTFGGGEVTSVSVGKRGIVAAAVKEDPQQLPGRVVFFDSDGTVLSDVEVGAGPDAVAFSPDGSRLVVMNEGEPLDYCTPGEDDPEGSVSIINVPEDGVVDQDNVRTAGFGSFSEEDLPDGVRIFGPGASVAQDLEPEYSAISKDSRTAYVTLQENNALATVDLKTARVTKITALGFKDHSARGSGLDPSDRDGGINVDRWPVRGMYQPDAVASFQSRGETYLVTANEGDARDYDCYSEETRVGDLTEEELPEGISPEVQAEDQLGRLNITTATPAREGSGESGGRLEGLYSFGGRSFSVLDSSGRIVYDSRNLLEKITEREVPDQFNSDGSPATFDQRSDNKGPEPEGVVTGKFKDRKLAFVSNERVGGIVTVDVTNPRAVRVVDYVNETSDIAPETLDFIPASKSPSGRPLVALASEVSNTVSLYELRETKGRR